MTQIVLHGILAHKFGRNFMCEVSSVKELISSIDANRNGFHVELYKLAKQGMHYAIIVDGKKLSKLNEISKKLLIKKVHIIPTIIGSGAVAGAIVATMANVALSGALAAGTISFTTYILASVAISVVSLYLQTLLAPKAPEPAAIEASTRAIKESYTFSNKVNIAAQGLKVPVGYGRLLMPSNVIEYSTRNYPLNKRASEIFRYLGPTSPEPRRRPNVFEDIDPAPNYQGWGKSATYTGSLTFYYDPDYSHSADLSPAGWGWQAPSRAWGRGTIPFEFHNTGTETLYLYRTFSNTKSTSYSYGSSLDSSLIFATVGAKSVLKGYYFNVDAEWGGNQAILNAARQVSSYTYGLSFFGGSLYVSTFYISTSPVSANDNNIIGSFEIIVTCIGNVITWDNTVGGAPFPNFYPIYPYPCPGAQCNGNYCFVNTSAQNGTYACMYDCGPSPCPPGGAGVVIKQDAALGGGLGPQEQNIEPLDPDWYY